jgi:hypothetical protein
VRTKSRLIRQGFFAAARCGVAALDIGQTNVDLIPAIASASPKRARAWGMWQRSEKRQLTNSVSGEQARASRHVLTLLCISMNKANLFV